MILWRTQFDDFCSLIRCRVVINLFSSLNLVNFVRTFNSLWMHYLLEKGKMKIVDPSYLGWSVTSSMYRWGSFVMYHICDLMWVRGFFHLFIDGVVTEIICLLYQTCIEILSNFRASFSCQFREKDSTITRGTYIEYFILRTFQRFRIGN